MRTYSAVSILFVALAVLHFRHISAAGRCCVECDPSAGLYKYFSVVKFPSPACGECCMKPSDYWKFKIFEPGLTRANASSPCRARGFGNYSSTVTHGFGPVKITLDLYKRTNPSLMSRLEEKMDLITFVPGSKTYFPWEVVNDPVMGGVSESTFHVRNGTGYFRGTVKIVPFLGKPGFAIARTEGNVRFPNVTSFTRGIQVICRAKGTSGWKDNRGFQVQIQTRGGRSGMKLGTYTSQFSAPSSFGPSEVVAWDSFKLTWRGQPIDGPKLTDQLDQIMNIGIGAAGKAGDFDIELVRVQVV